MNDETINFLILLTMFFAFLAMMRGRKLQRQQRQLYQTLAHLQSVQAAPPAALDGASKVQVERLEDRVRVLERIVTDKGYDVATQIEALRDARRTEALLDSREPEVRS